LKHHNLNLKKMKTSLLSIGTIIAFFAASTFVTSCGGGSSDESTEQHDMDSHDHSEMANATFSCPMHPEITGKEGDTCSKCGMTLKASKDAEKNMDMSAMAKCPMHPEVTGKEGDTCSKCGMTLVLADNAEHAEGDHAQEN
jgi:rRNA maturation protein Nop10